MDTLKMWWTNLSLREKQMVSLGGIVVGMFLIYVLIWSPFTNHLEHLRNQISNQEKLLLWLQTTDKNIQLLTKPAPSQTTKSNVALLGVVQTHVNKNPVGNNISQLQQVDSETVQMRFQHVSFDTLIQWLTQLWQDTGLIISQSTITATGGVGDVDAEIVLKMS